MNKFGLLDESEPESAQNDSLMQKLAAFPNVSPRPSIDLAAIDAAAAPHGFVSRESINHEKEPESALRTTAGGRRRRVIPSEPTRHLAIRLTSSAYNRFVAYADRQQLTYHDALIELMNTAGE